MANKLIMTFDEYIKNPSGKGSAVNTGRDSSELSYQAKLDECIHKNGDIKYTCLKSSDGKTYYIYFLIPSDSTPGFFNDVVIELKAPTGEGTSNGNINKYTVNFFANDPSFVFTYAHAYNTHGLLISKLERKLNLRSLLQSANTRNPDNSIGYTKGIYFAYLLMKKYNLFDKSILDRKCVNGGINYLLSNIDSYDKKENERKKLIKDRKSNNKEKSIDKSIKQQSSNFTGIRPVGIISKIKGKSKINGSSHIIKKHKKI